MSNSKNAPIVESNYGLGMYLREIKGDAQNRGYRLRVGVLGYRNTPRDREFEYLQSMGYNYLEPVLYHTKIGASHLDFFLPERWLSVQEQGQFMDALNSHPEILSGEVTTVDILTQNVYIIGGLPAKELGLLNFPNGRGLLSREIQSIILGTNSVEDFFQG